MEREFPGLQLQMEVHRINMTIVLGNDVTSEPTKLNLERILGQEMIQKTGTRIKQQSGRQNQYSS